MAIALLTGQPGHGKTLRAMWLARKFLQEGRVVYVCNVEGLTKESGFLVLEKFEDWQDLPDGSVVVYDECYGAIPSRAPGRQAPAHVDALARHRHRGFDFILICQLGNQLDSFVRGLVDRHTHVRRRFGTSVVALLEWDRYSENLKAPPLITTRWLLDKSLYPLYKSATVHTVKRRIPWYIWGTPLLILATIAIAIAVPALFVKRAHEIEAKAGAPLGDALAAPGGAAQRASNGVHPLRLTEPLQLLRPRVEGAAWTAPGYDDVEFAPPPRIACMSSADSCTCLTVDQGTRFMMPDDICRLTARHGRYDPTYRRDRNADRPMRPEQSRTAAPPQRLAGTGAKGADPLQFRKDPLL